MKKIFILLMMILANGVVFLVDEDIDAYFNGTHIFFNSNNQVVLQWIKNYYVAFFLFFFQILHICNIIRN